MSKLVSIKKGAVTITKVLVHVGYSAKILKDSQTPVQHSYEATPALRGKAAVLEAGLFSLLVATNGHSKPMRGVPFA